MGNEKKSTQSEQQCEVCTSLHYNISLDSICIYLAVIRLLVPTHPVLHHQRSGVLSFPPFVHPKLCTHSECISILICLNLLLTIPYGA